MSLQAFAISLKGKQIESIPQLVAMPPGQMFYGLELNDNPLRELPESIGSPMNFFIRLDLQGTNITTLPVWTQTQVLGVILHAQYAIFLMMCRSGFTRYPEIVLEYTSRLLDSIIVLYPITNMVYSLALASGEKKGSNLKTRFEDRAISEFVSKFFTGLQKSRAEREMTRQIRSWVVAEKSDDFILDALKLNGLTQAELKDNPSYKLFGDVKVENWLKESTSLNTVWSNLGLTDLSREEVKATAALHIFLKYVIKYDSKAKKSISGITNKKLQQAAKPVVDPEELYWVKQILTMNDRNFLYIEWLVRGMPV
ncbi:unnamed protein product [Phytophthora lilii]|uniref:Unnamed protein product n=1 Tax=Phytophthora lilii TaxID=2077276 RepID=A0A9W7CNC5_9STRA|nr:unnamed protein product [Phytophthora lilii]